MTTNLAAQNLFPQEQEQTPKKVRRQRRRRVAFIWPIELSERISTLHERSGVSVQQLAERALHIGLDLAEKQLAPWIGPDHEQTNSSDPISRGHRG
jgi:hypothetical protein